MRCNRHRPFYVLVVVLVWIFVCRQGSADYGNLCRCVCGSPTEAQLTILIPSTFGCQDCTSSICKEHFPVECVDAPEVVVHCVNRTAWLPRLVIWSFFLLCGALVLCGIMMDYSLSLRHWLQEADSDVYSKWNLPNSWIGEKVSKCQEEREVSAWTNRANPHYDVRET